jgi:cytochrome c1
MADWRMHPEEGELLRYCDGELRARETSRLARHLEACWDCRTRLDDLKQTIAEYVRYRRDVLDPGLPQPPQPWKNLRGEFTRMQTPDDFGPAWKRIVPWRAVWLVACTLTAGTGVLFYVGQTSRPAGQAVPRVAAKPVAPSAPAPRPVTPPAPVVAPVRPAIPPVSGPEDELRVIAALDRIGANLGDPIEVVRTRSRIVVTCMGLDAGRMHEVRTALAGLPGVTVELSPRPVVSAAGARLEVAGAPHATMRAEVAEVARQFDSPADYEKFVDGLLKSSEAAMARAHALRGLAKRFPPGVEAPMSAAARALLAAMRERHEQVLASEVSSLERQVRPFLGPSAPAPPARPAGEDWRTRTLLVFAEAERVDRLVGAVFAGSQDATAGDATPAALAAALAKLESDVAQ